MSEEKSFPLRIWSGLFKKKHWEKMGNAIWLFGMLIDKVTREENGKGYVLGGKPVSYNDFQDELPVTRKQYHRYMQILRRGGYIHTRKSAGGLVIVINKSKKFTTRTRDNIVPTPPNKGTNMSIAGDILVPTEGTNMSPSLIDNKGDIKETEELLPDFLIIWDMLYGIFKLPEDALGGYKGDIVETIQRLGMNITEKACKVFIESEEDHPPTGRVKSISAFLHFKKIDEYVAMLPEEKQKRYYVCLGCSSVIMINDNEDAVRVMSGAAGLCAGSPDNPELGHEPMQRIEITQMIRDCQDKKMGKQQIRTIVDKKIKELQAINSGFPRSEEEKN